MTASPAVQMDHEEAAELSARFETAPAGAVVAWAVERFGAGLSLACSFQDCVLLDLAVAVDPGIEVLFLDTGAHFPETLDYVAAVRSHYGLNLVVLRPGPGADAWPCGSERCCEVRKVLPLDRHLAGRQAWMTGLKRVDAATRSDAPVVAVDERRGVVKINPIATWTDADVTNYQADHALPVHPLVPRGYLSIGCAPTTAPVVSGHDPRSGRWAGSAKVECGLHL